MLRIATKYPYYGLVRLQNLGSPRHGIVSCRNASGGGGKGGGGSTFLFWFSATALGIGGPVAYANYDPKFRSWLGANVPYSEDFIKAVLREEDSIIDQFVNYLKATKESAWKTVFGEEVEVIPAKPVVRVFPVEPVTVAKVTPSYEAGSSLKVVDDKILIHPGSIADLESKVSGAAAMAINSYNEAYRALHDHSHEIYKLVEASVENMNPRVWSTIKEKTAAKDDLIRKSEAAGKEALGTISALKMVLEKGAIDAPTDVVDRAKRNVEDVMADIDKAVGNLDKERRQANVTDKYWEKVEAARLHWMDEMEILFPGIDVRQKQLKVSSGDLDLFILYAFQKVLFYQKELKKLETLGESRLNRVLVDSGKEALVNAVVETEVEKERRRLQLEFQKEALNIRAEAERDVVRLMKCQTEAHAGHIEEACEKTRKATEEQLRKVTEELVAAEQGKLKAQLAAVTGRMNGLDAALKARSDTDKSTQASQALWSAGSMLFNALKTGDPSLPWSKQLRPLREEIKALKSAAADGDKLVDVVIGGIPKEAAERGVYTEEGLRERFLKVETVARRVALLPEGGGSLPMYFLSYLQSFLLINTTNPMSQAEVLNHPVDFSSLNTYEILQYARYWLDRGDFTMTLRYMNLLKGASRGVAIEWMRETRILLETQQAAKTLMAHAAESGRTYL